MGGGDPSQGQHIFWLFQLASGALAASGALVAVGYMKFATCFFFPFSATSRSNSAVVALCLELSSYHIQSSPAFLSLGLQLSPSHLLSESYTLTHSYTVVRRIK